LNSDAPGPTSSTVPETSEPRVAQIKSDEQLRIGEKDHLDQIIAQGLRARLDSESLVTGVLYVAVDIIPDAPPPIFHQLNPEFQEIPTVPSDLQQLMASVAHLNLQGLSEKLGGILAHFDMILGQLDVPAINAGVTNLLGSASHVVTAPDLTNSLTSLRRTLDQAEVLVRHVDGRVDPLVDSATNTLSDARKTLADLRVSLQNISDLVGPDSAVRPGLARALEELGNASRSVADLADLLKRDPNALLVGRKSKEQP
jgi:paraquat-inducible protein B